MLCERRGQSGFTLAEMLTVIAIIGILASLFLSTLPRVEDRAKRAACMNTMRQIGLALEAYVVDYHGQYPSVNGARMISQLSDNPWYFALQQYGIEGRALRCPADENFDRERFADDTQLTDRLIYRSNNISYGMQYDFRDPNGNFYEARMEGGWEGAEPDGIPDTLRVGDLVRRCDTILMADSDGNGIEDYAIDVTGIRKIGDRHKGYGNVLFADIHVEAKEVRPEKGVDINAEYRYWTLTND